ncbi:MULTISPECIES: sodium:calcium antiporter [Dactylosporangium]|uniref:Sodium:calcium antiporter n=2 Tax=Dactylosporangium TaxID=35753 RepID=A0A9W6NPD1_9ACTN|nr:MULTISPECIES: sodium:calcium antiporter [Dactylosporangium]UAB98658.1 sodium:calcium antiporter [Dactylosporangium vinaceum]UWZ46910.1 sodium:calcium antiporter [Dactylosporangium matsuzakiense]GLL04198.1 sodium:calcium antiporter [Dactylosporangium matsuzakiense]
MSTLFVAGLGIVGLALLTVGADQLVVGAGRLATVLRVAPVIVGVVIIGLGTSTPEFVVSGTAAVRGNAGLALGNLVGSNILNVTLILGVVAVVSPVLVRSSVPVREAPLMVAGVSVFGAFALVGLKFIAGVLLALLSLGALWLLVRLSRVPPDDPLPDDVAAFVEPPPPPGRWWVEAARCAIGLAATLGGAQLLVTNASTLAHRWGVSDAVIGFTFVALGTSLPELMTSVQAQRRGWGDLMVGNLLGSNLFNSLVGGAVVGLAAGRERIAPFGFLAVTAMVVAGVLAWLLLKRGNRITRPEACVLLCAYGLMLPLLVSANA